MKKTIITLLLAVAGMCAMAQTDYDFADTATDGTVLLYTVTDSAQGQVSVKGLPKDTGDVSTIYTGTVTIPPTVMHDGTTYTVAEIGEMAFTLQFGITAVTIPPTVTSIDTSAFYGCIGLPEINLPDGVATIGCSAFGYCQGAQSIIIPPSVTEIGQSAFYASGHNADVVVGCTSCIVKPEAFSYATINTIDLGSGITSLGANALAGLIGTREITIPAGIVHIGDSLFNESLDLRKVTMPDDIDTLTNSMFAMCSNLREINLPASLRHIGDRAMMECNQLVSLEIPEGVESIGSEAFRYSNRLRNIVCHAEVPPALGENALDGVSSALKVTVPCGSGDAYRADSQWGTATIIEDCDGMDDIVDPDITVIADGHTVSVSGNGITRLEAYNAAGIRVYDHHSTSIDITRWPAGIYLLRIHTPQGTCVKRLTVL